MSKDLRFTLDVPPQTDSVELLRQYTYDQLQRLAIVLDLVVQGKHEIHYAAPTKRVEADVVYADGTLWNPGSGKGFYYWSGSAWTFIA